MSAEKPRLMVAEFTIRIPFMSSTPLERRGALHREAIEFLEDEINEGGGIESFDSYHVDEMTSLNDVDDKWHDCLVWGDESNEDKTLETLFEEQEGKEVENEEND